MTPLDIPALVAHAVELGMVLPDAPEDYGLILDALTGALDPEGLAPNVE